MRIDTANQPAICPEKLNGTMTTLSGKTLDLMKPDPSMICIEDIASGLANKGHFSGQSPYFFSIAQHSIMVCDEFASMNPAADDKWKLMALLHDASEAYIGDMIKPLKVFMPDFVKVEQRLMESIAQRFNLPLDLMPMIKPYDLYVQNLEYDTFYRGANHFKYKDPFRAKRVFLDRFEEYYYAG